jgi:hypothetical protein
MAFKMDCPYCRKILNVTEKAFGKTLPCPGCNQSIAVPKQEPMQASVARPATTMAQAASVAPMRASPPPPPSKTPPATRETPPQAESTLDFLNNSLTASPPSRNTVPVAQVHAAAKNKKMIWLLVGGTGTAILFVAILLVTSGGSPKKPAGTISSSNHNDNSSKQDSDSNNASSHANNSKNGGISKRGFSMDYKIVEDPGEVPRIAITVKGPATRLAVILTRPNGEASIVETIRPEQMITNSCTVGRRLPDWGSCVEPGKYTLTVKTFSPEEVVCQQDMVFSLEKLVVEDVKFDLEPVARMTGGSIGAFTLKNIGIALRKEGNLPLGFSGGTCEVGNLRCQCMQVVRGSCDGQTQRVALETHVFANDKTEQADKRHGWGGMPSVDAMFWPGDRYVVKGRLFYSDDRTKYIDFEKELVVEKK